MATFTALNGGSPKATDGVNGSVDMARSGSDDQRTNGPAAAAASAAAVSIPSGEPKSAAPSDVSPSASRGREGWPGPGLDRPSYPPPTAASYGDVENPHKRKRSDSPESRRDRDHQPAAPERRDESAPPTAQRHPSESRDMYGTPQRDYRPYGDEGREHSDWYGQSRDDRSGYDVPQSALPGSAHGDESMDSLRRAASQMDGVDYQTSPDGDDRSLIYSGYSPDQRRDGVILADPKKRKRNFSNRTKTGCLTCRKRKKKCDETKPECESKMQS